MFTPTLPFRPVPVYGQRSPLGLPGSANALQQTQSPAKFYGNQLTLAKHMNMISHLGQFRALGNYPFLPQNQIGNFLPDQVAREANKPSVKNLAMIGNTGPSHAMLPVKAPNFENQKRLELTTGQTSSEINLGAHANAVNNNRALIDSLTVPVILSCATPFTSQYGYGRKVFPCPQCRYTTDRRNNLKRHMLTMHQTCAKTLECCGIVFATKASLREHAMIFHYHGYTCYYCGRRFCRKALLKRHLSVHNGQKDFVCPVCDYATSHKSNLERHRKVHCRPEDRKSDEMDYGVNEASLTWKSDGQIRDDNNNSHVISSSEDEDEEINVDSD